MQKKEMTFVFESFAYVDDANAFAAMVNKDFGLSTRFNVDLHANGGPIVHVQPVPVGHKLPAGEQLLDAESVGCSTTATQNRKPKQKRVKPPSSMRSHSGGNTTTVLSAWMRSGGRSIGSSRGEE
jgi:hypothetical protein